MIILIITKVFIEYLFKNLYYILFLFIFLFLFNLKTNYLYFFTCLSFYTLTIAYINYFIKKFYFF